ncbi:MAG: hypothetical protein P8J87_11220 [Verrucomicrobiales bacterium]|nr:hypothetical protein [Verrucomicrobiales bacterium]
MLAPYLTAAATGDMVNALVVLFALLVGHALGDFPLQGDFLAVFKNPGVDTTGDNIPPEVRGLTIWPYCLTAHALIHGGIVGLILGSPLLALIEFFLHWIIDLGKGLGMTNFHADQSLHIVCKIGYIAAILLGWVKY